MKEEQYEGELDAGQSDSAIAASSSISVPDDAYEEIAKEDDDESATGEDNDSNGEAQGVPAVEGQELTSTTSLPEEGSSAKDDKENEEPVASPSNSLLVDGDANEIDEALAQDHPGDEIHEEREEETDDNGDGEAENIENLKGPPNTANEISSSPRPLIIDEGSDDDDPEEKIEAEDSRRMDEEELEGDKNESNSAHSPINESILPLIDSMLNDIEAIEEISETPSTVAVSPAAPVDSSSLDPPSALNNDVDKDSSVPPFSPSMMADEASTSSYDLDMPRTPEATLENVVDEMERKLPDSEAPFIEFDQEKKKEEVDEDAQSLMISGDDVLADLEVDNEMIAEITVVGSRFPLLAIEWKKEEDGDEVAPIIQEEDVHPVDENHVMDEIEDAVLEEVDTWNEEEEQEDIPENNDEEDISQEHSELCESLKDLGVGEAMEEKGDTSADGAETINDDATSASPSMLIQPPRTSFPIPPVSSCPIVDDIINPTSNGEEKEEESGERPMEVPSTSSAHSAIEKQEESASLIDPQDSVKPFDEQEPSLPNSSENPRKLSAALFSISEYESDEEKEDNQKENPLTSSSSTEQVEANTPLLENENGTDDVINEMMEKEGIEDEEEDNATLDPPIPPVPPIEPIEPIEEKEMKEGEFIEEDVIDENDDEAIEEVMENENGDDEFSDDDGMKDEKDDVEYDKREVTEDDLLEGATYQREFSTDEVDELLRDDDMPFIPIPTVASIDQTSSSSTPCDDTENVESPKKVENELEEDEREEVPIEEEEISPPEDKSEEIKDDDSLTPVDHTGSSSPINEGISSSSSVPNENKEVESLESPEGQDEYLEEEEEGENEEEEHLQSPVDLPIASTPMLETSENSAAKDTEEDTEEPLEEVIPLEVKDEKMEEQETKDLPATSHLSKQLSTLTSPVAFTIEETEDRKIMSDDDDEEEKETEEIVEDDEEDDDIDVEGLSNAEGQQVLTMSSLLPIIMKALGKTSKEKDEDEKVEEDNDDDGEVREPSIPIEKSDGDENNDQNEKIDHSESLVHSPYYAGEITPYKESPSPPSTEHNEKKEKGDQEEEIEVIEVIEEAVKDSEAINNDENDKILEETKDDPLLESVDDFTSSDQVSSSTLSIPTEGTEKNQKDEIEVEVDESNLIKDEENDKIQEEANGIPPLSPVDDVTRSPQAPPSSPLSVLSESAEMEEKDEQKDDIEEKVEESDPIKDEEETKIDEIVPADKEKEESLEEEIPLIDQQRHEQTRVSVFRRPNTLKRAVPSSSSSLPRRQPFARDGATTTSHAFPRASPPLRFICDEDGCGMAFASEKELTDHYCEIHIPFEDSQFSLEDGEQPDAAILIEGSDPKDEKKTKSDDDMKIDDEAEEAIKSEEAKKDSESDRQEEKEKKNEKGAEKKREESREEEQAIPSLPTATRSDVRQRPQSPFGCRVPGCPYILCDRQSELRHIRKVHEREIRKENAEFRKNSMKSKLPKENITQSSRSPSMDTRPNDDGETKGKKDEDILEKDHVVPRSNESRQQQSTGSKRLACPDGCTRTFASPEEQNAHKCGGMRMADNHVTTRSSTSNRSVPKRPLRPAPTSSSPLAKLRSRRQLQNAVPAEEDPALQKALFKSYQEKRSPKDEEMDGDNELLAHDNKQKDEEEEDQQPLRRHRTIASDDNDVSSTRPTPITSLPIDDGQCTRGMTESDDIGSETANDVSPTTSSAPPTSLLSSTSQTQSLRNILCPVCKTLFASQRDLSKHTKKSHSAEEMENGFVRQRQEDEEDEESLQRESEEAMKKQRGKVSMIMLKNGMASCPICHKEGKVKSMATHLRYHTDEERQSVLAKKRSGTSATPAAAAPIPTPESIKSTPTHVAVAPTPTSTAAVPSEKPDPTASSSTRRRALPTPVNTLELPHPDEDIYNYIDLRNDGVSCPMCETIKPIERLIRLHISKQHSQADKDAFRKKMMGPSTSSSSSSVPPVSSSSQPSPIEQQSAIAAVPSTSRARDARRSSAASTTSSARDESSFSTAQPIPAPTIVVSSESTEPVTRPRKTVSSTSLGYIKFPPAMTNDQMIEASRRKKHALLQQHSPEPSDLRGQRRRNEDEERQKKEEEEEKTDEETPDEEEKETNYERKKRRELEKYERRRKREIEKNEKEELERKEAEEEEKKKEQERMDKEKKEAEEKEKMEQIEKKRLDEEERRKKEEAEQEEKRKEERRLEEEKKVKDQTKRGRGRPPGPNKTKEADDEATASTPAVSDDGPVISRSTSRGGRSSKKNDDETASIQSTPITTDEFPSASTRGGRSKKNSKIDETKIEGTTSTPVASVPSERTEVATPSSSLVGRSLKKRRVNDEETPTASAASIGELKEETEKKLSEASPPVKRGRKPGPKGEKKIDPDDQPSTSSGAEIPAGTAQPTRASRQRPMRSDDSMTEEPRAAESENASMRRAVSTIAPTMSQGSASMRRITRSGMPMNNTEEEEADTSTECSSEDKKSDPFDAVCFEEKEEEVVSPVPTKRKKQKVKEEEQKEVEKEEEKPLSIRARPSILHMPRLTKVEELPKRRNTMGSSIDRKKESSPAPTSSRRGLKKTKDEKEEEERSNTPPPLLVPSIPPLPASATRGRKAKGNEDPHLDTAPTLHLPPSIPEEEIDHPSASTPSMRGRTKKMDKKSEDHPTSTSLQPPSLRRGRALEIKTEEKSEDPSTLTPKRGRKAKGDEPREEEPRPITPPPVPLPPPTRSIPTRGRLSIVEEIVGEPSASNRGRKRKADEVTDSSKNKKDDGKRQKK